MLTLQRRSLIIRHLSRHRVVAFLEIVSRGNKASSYPFDLPVTKIAAALAQGIHVLVVDLDPPTPRDPNGIHAAIWEAIHAGTFQPPPDKPLTLASYNPGLVKTACLEPVRGGDALRPMPLFLESGLHVSVPLEETYSTAYRSTPAFYRERLDRPE